MDLLHRLRSGLAVKRRELDTIQILNRLNDRGLADLGLTRAEIRPVARLAARLGPSGMALTEIVALARETDTARADAPSRRHGLADAIATAARRLAGPMMRRVAATEPYRRMELARIRRREFLRLRTQLDSYSDRELMADLRLTRSEIEDVAADGAQRLVDTVVRDQRGHWRAPRHAAGRVA
jgi:uncharacterized protein YjiS (DUF1127 family)